MPQRGTQNGSGGNTSPHGIHNSNSGTAPQKNINSAEAAQQSATMPCGNGNTNSRPPQNGYMNGGNMGNGNAFSGNANNGLMSGGHASNSRANRGSAGNGHMGGVNANGGNSNAVNSPKLPNVRRLTAPPRGNAAPHGNGQIPNSSQQCGHMQQSMNGNHSNPQSSNHNSNPQQSGNHNHPPQNGSHNAPPQHGGKNTFNISSILNSIIPSSVYNPETKKVFGILTAEDLLIVALIFLFSENSEDCDPLLIPALIYILLSDYIDLPELPI